jgi:hypothetical protein
LVNNGTLQFSNTSPGNVNLFIDNGGTNPTYQQHGIGNFLVPAAATGEYYTI